MRMLTFIAVCLLSFSLVLGPVSAAIGQVPAACCCRMSADAGPGLSLFSSRLSNTCHCTQKTGQSCEKAPGLPPIKYSALPAVGASEIFEGPAVWSNPTLLSAVSAKQVPISPAHERSAQPLYLQNLRLVI